MPFADRPQVEHEIERGDLIDADRRHIEELGHLVHRHQRQPAELTLRQVEQLVENYAVVLDEILRVKPASAKGRYIFTIALATTMGPGIQVDSNKTRNLLVDDGTEA